MNKKIQSITLLLALTATVAIQPMSWNNVKQTVPYVAGGLALAGLGYYAYKSYVAVQEINKTAKTVNLVVDTAQGIIQPCQEALQQTKDTVKEAANQAVETATNVVDAVKETAQKAKSVVSDKIALLQSKMQSGMQTAQDAKATALRKIHELRQQRQEEESNETVNDNVADVVDTLATLIAENKFGAVNEIEKILTNLDPKTRVQVLNFNNKTLLTRSKNKAAGLTIEGFYRAASLLN